MGSSPSRAIATMRRYATIAKSSFFLIILLNVLVQSSRASNHGLNDELHFIHREIGLLRDENRHQNQEIDLLKEIMGLQNQKIIPKQMEEDLIDDETIEEWRSRSKRPARLLPFHILFRPKNDTSDIPRRFYGPPTNCFELSELGYTLNGFYLVGSNKKVGDPMQVEPVFCAFKNQEGIYKPSNLSEKRASFTFIKNDGIHFRARLTSNLEAKKSTNILFDNILLNHGGGSYDPKTGQFTIPKTGIYQITFRGLIRSPTANQNDLTYIFLMVNDAHLNSPEGTKITDSQQPLNEVLLTTMKLVKGDKISIYVHLMSGNNKLELKIGATISCSLLESID